MTSTAADSPIGGPPLVRRAVHAVTEHIRGERLRVGDTLPGEHWFATELGVSRAVMREAFGALAALRLIDVGNGRKPKVAAINGSVFAVSLDHAISTSQVQMADVWEVRRTLEVRTVELAAIHRTDAQASQLLQLAAQMAIDAKDMALITRHDIAFHTCIAEACQNALYRQIVSSFAPLMEEAVPAAWRTREQPDQRDDVLHHHRAIAEAIAERQPERAVKAMNAHFDTSIGDLLNGMAHAAE